VTGYSYGGYMTCYLTSRDDRFAAAFPAARSANLTSLAGTSGQGHALAGLRDRRPVVAATTGTCSPRCPR